MRYLTPLLSFVLIPLLITAPLSAQIVENPGGPTDAATSQDLQIRVIAGDTGSAPVNSQAASGFTVEVIGTDGTGVADAAVALRVPDTEPTGVFPDGSHAVVAYTDQAGHAHLPAVKWGGTPGVVAIRVTAVKGTAHAGILVEEKVLAASVVPAAEPLAALPAPIMPPAPALAQTTPSPIAQPAVLAKPANVETAAGDTTAPTHALTPAAPAPKPEPSVSVTSSVPPGTQAHSHKKWIIIAAIAAGAGAGIAFAGRGKGSNTSSSASSLTIGSPTVSVGHP